MTERNIAALVLWLGLLAPYGVQSQITSKLEAGDLMTAKDGVVPASVMNLSPDVRWAGSNFMLAARGSAWLDGQQWQVADGGVSTSANTPTVHHFSGEILANASRAFDPRSMAEDQADGQARVHFLTSRGGFWFGSGIERPWRVAVVSSVDVTGAGAWTRLGDVTISGTYTDFFFTKATPTRDSAGAMTPCSRSADLALPTSDPGSSDCSRYSRFADVESAVHWEHESVELAAQAGYRIGDAYDVAPNSRRWAAVSAIYWISPLVAGMIGAGRLPASPERGLPARSYTTVGLVFAYSGATHNTPVASPVVNVRNFEVRPASGGIERITVHMGGVESVEIMGDFTDWEPVTMTRHGRDLWELTLAIPPGVHQINVRVDEGKWLAPPGMPAMRDGYSGEVGLLIVP